MRKDQKENNGDRIKQAFIDWIKSTDEHRGV